MYVEPFRFPVTNRMDLELNDVTRPKRQYGSCSHAQIQLRWRPIVLVVGEIVEVGDLELELDPKFKQIARAVTRRSNHIKTHVSINAI